MVSSLRGQPSLDQAHRPWHFLIGRRARKKPRPFAFNLASLRAPCSGWETSLPRCSDAVLQPSAESAHRAACPFHAGREKCPSDSSVHHASIRVAWSQLGHPLLCAVPPLPEDDESFHARFSAAQSFSRAAAKTTPEKPFQPKFEILFLSKTFATQKIREHPLLLIPSASPPK